MEQSCIPIQSHMIHRRLPVCYITTVWLSVFLVNLTKAQLQSSSSATYTKRYRGHLNTIHTHIIYLFRVYFTIILPCTSTFFKLSPPFMFSDISYLKYSSLMGCTNTSLELQSHNIEGITTP